MATKSLVAQLTNFLSGARNEPQATKGHLHRAYFAYEKVAGNTDGDWILFLRVHSSWILSSIMMQNDALSGCSDADLGLYADIAAGGAAADAVVVDVNAYYDALTLASALGLTQYGFQAAGGRDKAAVGNKVWQDAGLSAEPDGGRWYLLGLTLVTGGTAAGTISGYVDIITPS